ncbi:hypothetical protein SAMN02983003_2469 [Devosia enhydra]|uniref:Uncharacterized protein n=1 Tax=Devosia enhydra TaxID=665118 RepID=A0A1K2HYU2_9HYPH|nr:hypothetical protein [Devosia enhydra]SFZ85249.1 hypothetical protein SAMN02983003_2469 [Devosia enhydra]
MRAMLFAALSMLAAGPALAQTDDRILNDVFAVLRGEAILDQTRQLCLDFADTDLSADFVDWRARNDETLRLANLLLIRRPGLEPGMLDTLRAEAESEAGASFGREADRPAFCEEMGEAMALEALDLKAWFPRQTTRMSEALAGKWPPLDLTDVPPVEDAIEVKQLFFAMQDGLVRCGVLFPPAAPYDAAYAEWEARNSYTRDLADRVLENWGALHPQRWADARDEAGAIVDETFADKDAARAQCERTLTQVPSGELDIDQQRPELFDSVRRNAEIMP